ncbi:hypothetical protein NQ317_005698 [Molorchus minor]|uniref:Gustatory receptor n=1 Tax=Molorchus minor TaxID=1323400 RepID=A0ABQ9J6G1_9CUCU|nr:hypothetical protein NQ317_005698 [Molorchus minor]
MTKGKVEIYEIPKNSASPEDRRITDRNMKFCRFAYRIGNVFCITPWYDFEKKRLRWPVLNQVYAVVIGLALGGLSVTTLLKMETEQKMNSFETILASLCSIISISLTEFLIFGSIFLKRKTYALFVERFCQDLHIAEWKYEYEGITLFYIQFIAGHIFFIAMASYNYFVFSMFGTANYHLKFVLQVATQYYCFLSALMASNQLLAIKGKYRLLNKVLVNQTKNGAQAEKEIVINILEVGKFYRSFTDTVGYYNDLFGWVTVFIFWHAIVQLLRCPNLFLRTQLDSATFWMVFVEAFLVAAVSMGEAVYLVWCCQAATTAGKEIVPLCNKLQENFGPDSRARDELFKLAYVAKTYEPTFTAANFFVINKGTILQLFNVATTYLIVIIQFYTANSN